MAGAVWLYVTSPQIISPFGFDQKEALYIVLIPSCGFGFLGALVFGFIVKRLKVKKRFKTVFLTCQSLTLLATIFL